MFDLRRIEEAERRLERVERSLDRIEKMVAWVARHTTPIVELAEPLDDAPRAVGG